MSSIGHFIRSRWRERDDYQDVASWLWCIYSRFVFRLPRLPWPLRGHAVRVRLRGVDRPFEVRLGTTDFAILGQIYLEGEYAQVADLPAAQMGSILDLGSNAGYSIRLWQDRFPTARIVGVEPDESNFRTLRGNMDAGGEGGGAGTLRLFRCCVAAKAGEVTLERGDNQSGYRMMSAAAEADRVEAKTVPGLLKLAGIDGPIDLLKCDIEGAEQEVFGDCGAWIGRVRHIIVETHPPYGVDLLVSDIARCGGRFRTVGIEEVGYDEARGGPLHLVYLEAA